MVFFNKMKTASNGDIYCDWCGTYIRNDMDGGFIEQMKEDIKAPFADAMWEIGNTMKGMLGDLMSQMSGMMKNSMGGMFKGFGKKKEEVKNEILCEMR